MKIVERDICETCGTEYTDKERCAKCEDWHIGPVRIRGAAYVPYGQDTYGYPMSVKIEMEDGKTIKYER